MNKEELQIWFRNKFNSCYLVIHEDYPESIFMFYDPKFIRQKKMCRINDEEIKYPEKPSGICIFEQDYKDGRLYMDYNEIYSFFLKNYSSDWLDIKELIHDWLKKDTKLKVLTPFVQSLVLKLKLKKDTKLKVLTPLLQDFRSVFTPLKEDTKLKVLTPFYLRKYN